MPGARSLSSAGFLKSEEKDGNGSEMYNSIHLITESWCQTAVGAATGR